jgi:hypothetical protein
VRVLSDCDLERDFSGQHPLLWISRRRQLDEGSSAGRVFSMG